MKQSKIYRQRLIPLLLVLLIHFICIDSSNAFSLVKAVRNFIRNTIRDNTTSDGDDIICPVPSPDSICNTMYKPVICGKNKCRYGNQCTAASSGYDVDKECKNQRTLYLRRKILSS